MKVILWCDKDLRYGDSPKEPIAEVTWKPPHDDRFPFRGLNVPVKLEFLDGYKQLDFLGRVILRPLMKELTGLNFVDGANLLRELCQGSNFSIEVFRCCEFHAIGVEWKPGIDK